MKVDQAKAKDMMTRMKGSIRSVLNDYATEASNLALNSDDPHSPVIACAQMALANAAADYLALCGATGPECFQITVNVTGQAMEKWVGAVMNAHGIKKAATNGD